MLSYRDNLIKIGIPREAACSYREFYSRPPSLRQAIYSMDAPQNWQQVLDIFVDEHWTDEVQGVTHDGANWIFSANARQNKPGHNDKAIYVFKGGTKLKDDQWMSMIKYKDVPHPVTSHEGDDHWGQLTYYNGFVYVSHFWYSDSNIMQGQKGEKNVVVFKDEGGYLQFTRWIPLGEVKSSDGRKEYPEFQAINPWDGKLYTCLDKGPIYEFFLHEPDTGEWTGETLCLGGLAPHKVEGVCFSPNSHLYVADDTRYTDFGRDYKSIFYYSALNGAMLGRIPVLALEGGQELEGLCYANTSLPDGRSAQIHVILLENRDVALDNIFFMSFSADLPDMV